MTEVNKDNYDEEVVKSSRPVLLDLFAQWCGPCKLIAPILEQISDERPDVKVAKFDIDGAEDFVAGNFPGAKTLQQLGGLSGRHVRQYDWKLPPGHAGKFARQAAGGF